MAKKCLKCNASVNNNSYECPFCGSNRFESLADKSENIRKEDTALQKGIYSEKIMSLIDLALSDGELTEKEKQVLFKKAEIEGIDLDEFEMVLEARLYSRHKEGVSSKKKDNVIKCHSCNDIIPALSKICPSCSFVLDAGRQSSESEKGLEDLIADIEDNLVQLKSIKKPNIIATLFERTYITLPALSILLFVIGVRLSSVITFLLGLVLAFLSWLVIKKKLKETNYDKNNPTFNILKANFEKHSRTARTLYGENRKVRLLLEELNVELNNVDKEIKKSKTTESISYGLLSLLIIGLFFIPKTKTQNELAKEQEITIRQTVQEFINTGQAKKAEEYYILHANGNNLIDYNIKDLALTVMQALIDENLLKEAESYLNKGHSIWVDREDLAKSLVLKYIKNDDLQSAERVISGLEEYKQERLNKLLPKNKKYGTIR